MFSFRSRTPLQRLMMVGAIAKANGEPTTEQTATGNPVVFSTDLARNLTGLTIPFDTAGISGLNIYHTGKNLFDKTAPVSEENKYLKTDGSENGSGNYNISAPIVAVAGATYNFSGLAGGSPAAVFYNASGERLSGVAYNSSSSVYKTAPEGTAYMKVSIPKAKVDEFQIEIGSSATEYEAYSGESFAVAFGETANKGSFDAVSGVVTVITPAEKTISLEPVPIATLVGNNTLCTDTGGSNTVKYLKKA